MAIFRFNPAFLFIVFSLACISREGSPEAASADGQEAKIQKTRIEHVIPPRDFVGKTPSVLEWTAVPGVDSYVVSVDNEIEISVFEQEGIVTNSMPWPKAVKVDPGTYFWRIIGLKGEHIVADSGRAAFVVRE
ncbi:MAG: hypothetical protein ABI983_08975 [Acidobacteriota bacterium]